MMSLLRGMLATRAKVLKEINAKKIDILTSEQKEGLKPKKKEK